MDKEYSNLTQMLNECPQAKSYFDSLPDYVRSSIQERGDNVQTQTALHGYAENLLKGDG